MDNKEFFLYLIVMAGSTYLIRSIPFALCKNKIENTFVKSFLHYIPYAVLAAMTIPAVFYSTSLTIAAVIGFVLAVVLSMRGGKLLTVAVCSCIAVFVVEFFL